MLRFICFCVFFLLTGSAEAKPSIIQGTIIANETYHVQFFESFQGYANPYNTDTSTHSAFADRKGRFFKIIQLERPTFFSLSFSRGHLFLAKTHFLVLPGDTIKIRIDLNVTDSSWILFSGSNGAGNQLFEQINFDPYQKFKPVISLLNKLPSDKHNLMANVDREVEKVTARFRELYKQRSISRPYLEAIGLNFKMLFYDEVVRRFLFWSKPGERVSKGFRDSTLLQVYTRLPHQHRSLRGLYLYYIYQDHYFRYLGYKKYRLQTGDDFNIGDSILAGVKQFNRVDKELVHLLPISDSKAKEDLWAITLLRLFEFSKGYLDETALGQFDLFFPGSKWQAILKRKFEITNSPKEITYKLSTPISYLPAFDDLSQALAQFKGRPVYIDVWASWCGPCVTEFMYNTGLDSFLLAKGIARLYVSLDRNEEAWVASVDKFKLGGYHLRANESFLKSLKSLQKIADEDGLTIPMYYLKTGGGKLIDVGDFRPNTGQALQVKLLSLLE